MLRPLEISSFIILLFLLFITFSIITKGPLKDILKNGNIFVQSMLSVEDIEKPLIWPALSICKIPFYRNKTKYYHFLKKGRTKSFKSESEYHNLLEESFFNKPEEIIYTIGYGNDYTSATEGNSEKILKPPFLKSTFMDFHFLGFCATVHFEAIKSKMISEGKTDENAIDSKFFVAIGLRVST